MVIAIQAGEALLRGIVREHLLGGIVREHLLGGIGGPCRGNPGVLREELAPALKIRGGAGRAP